jgi:hypothetical protein
MASSLDAAKEKIIDAVSLKWSEFQESSTYMTFKEKHDDLNPIVQKLIKYGVAITALLILLLIPFSFLSSSWDKVDEFTEKKTLVRELLRLRRDLNQAPVVPTPPTSAQLKSQVDSLLTEFQLLPEQIAEVTTSQFHSSSNPAETSQSNLIPKTFEQEGVQASLQKLTLTQIVDLSFRLKGLNAGAKLLAMDMKASSFDPHYYDVMFRLVSFSIPASSSSKPEGNLKK